MQTIQIKIQKSLPITQIKILLQQIIALCKSHFAAINADISSAGPSALTSLDAAPCTAPVAENLKTSTLAAAGFRLTTVNVAVPFRQMPWDAAPTVASF